MPVGALFLAAAAVGACVLYGGFLYLERKGRSATVVAVVACLLTVEVLLYSSQNDISAGLFHPRVGPLTFRVFDVVLPMALLARFQSRPQWRGPGGPMLLWTAFFAWYVACGAVGLLRGHSAGLIAIELKAVLYVVGTMILAAGVPVARYVDDRLFRVVVPLAVAATVLLLVTGRGYSLRLPGLPLPRVGGGAPDAASVLLTVALVVVAGARRAAGRLGFRLALLVPMLLVGVVAGQRASLLSALLAFVVLLAGLALAPSHSRLRATPTQVVLGALALLAFAAGPTFVRSVASGEPVRVPYAARVVDTFNRPSKTLSGTVRVNQQRAARPLIAERPWLGWGLGVTYSHYDPGLFVHAETNLTHNIATDIWLRAGAAGLGLFLAALAASMAAAFRTWRRHPDPRVSSLVLGLSAALVGLLAKGAVEPLFDKYRLAVLLGLLLGVLRSADRDRASVPAPAPPVRSEPALVA